MINAVLHNAGVATIFLYISYMIDNAGTRYDLSYIGSDTLQPAFIARDLLRHPSLILDWSFPDAPYFFPDLVYALVTAPLSAFPMPHTALLGLLQAYVAISLAVWLLRRHATAEAEASFYFALSIVGVFFLLSAAMEFRLIGVMQTYGVLFKIWYHTGALTGTLLLLLIEFYLQNITKQTKHIFFIFTIYALILLLLLLSDKLIVFFYVLPILCVRFWQWLTRETSVRPFLRSLLASVLAAVVALTVETVAGVETNMREEGWDTLAEITSNAGEGLRFLAVEITDSSTPWLYQTLQILIKVPVLAATLAVVASLGFGFYKSLRHIFPSHQAWSMFCFWIVGYWINGIAIFTFGLYHNTWYNRYLLVTDVAWIFVTALFAGSFAARVRKEGPLRGRVFRRIVAPALGIGMACYALVLSEGDLYDFAIAPHAAARPPVRCLPTDLLAEAEARPRLGLSSGGVARRGTAERDGRLLILAIRPDGQPKRYTTNAAHYAPDYLERQVDLDAPAVIFLEKLDGTAIRRRYGEPQDTLTCSEEASILVYENARQLVERL